jgi:uncharacterized protein (DUF305 family)
MKEMMLTPKLAILACSAALFFSACGQGDKKDTSGATVETTTEAAQGQDTTQGMQMSKMMDHMHEHMKDMQQVQMTGDPDLDFSRMMAAHHQGAIDMSAEELANGTDADLKALASKIATASKAEKEKLEDFAEEHQAAAGDTAASMKLMQPMKTMMGSMKHDQMGGDTDHHFATMMRMHHQTGIDMMKAYLDLAKVPGIKSMARKMMEDQQKDIQQLDDWLKKHPR